MDPSRKECRRMAQRKALFSVAFALTRSSEFDRNPADGSNPVRLTGDPAIDIEPSWQPLP